MSASPYFYIEFFNSKSGNWEKVDIYFKNPAGEYVAIDLWPWNGSHALFTILDCEDSYIMPEFTGIHYGLPINASQEMYAEFDSHCANVENDGFNFVPEVKYFNVADAKLYLMQHPVVDDADEMEMWWAQHETVAWEDVPKAEMANPLSALIKKVEAVLDFWDAFWYINSSWSDVRVIYWVNY